ncbi:hypothetical protein CHS0354_038264 [Potamilus streckersoni]|uniref:Uncharacterized protein n=1 Tax=Potamilus streckersoni TaxID=2493646 RepID=A0AAE0TCS8_9BIVA|nr:hypothetical protein CHS0354_038264 [Potamilus streckersoni]
MTRLTIKGQLPTDDLLRLDLSSTPSPPSRPITDCSAIALLLLISKREKKKDKKYASGSQQQRHHYVNPEYWACRTDVLDSTVNQCQLSAEYAMYFIPQQWRRLEKTTRAIDIFRSRNQKVLTRNPWLAKEIRAVDRTQKKKIISSSFDGLATNGGTLSAWFKTSFCAMGHR